MSRGPGRWQRVILHSLADHEMRSVLALVMAETGQAAPSRAACSAARRAASKLARSGAVRTLYLNAPHPVHGGPVVLLVVARPDATVAGLAHRDGGHPGGPPVTMGTADIAAALGVSRRTVQRDLRRAEASP